jgi:peptide/nickel transport system ATP-binding protein
LNPPYHPYTEALLAAIPQADPARATHHSLGVKPDVTSARSERGCPFSTRCPRKLGEICETVPPPVIEDAPGHTIVCHIPLKDLRKFPSVLPDCEVSHEGAER